MKTTNKKTIMTSTVMAISMLTVVGVMGLSQNSYAAEIFYVGTDTGDLYEIDVPAGTSTLIGNMGVTMTDIALDPITGDLYGITFSHLYSIDKTNASTVLIGALGTGDSNALTFGDDGTLYEAGTGSTDLRTVDLTDGSTTVVGDMGYASSGDLIWDATLDMLWFSTSFGNDSLVLVDPTDASSLLIGPFGFSQVYGLGMQDGVLYGTTTNGQLISIDTSNGAGTLVNPTVFGIFGATDDKLLVEETAWADGSDFSGNNWAMYVPFPEDCTPISVDLLADQDKDAGQVDITCSGNQITIDITMENGWDLTGSHLHVADDESGIPQNGGGNPKPGKFDYNGDETVFQYIVTHSGEGVVALHTGVETLQ